MATPSPGSPPAPPSALSAPPTAPRRGSRSVIWAAVGAVVAAAILVVAGLYVLGDLTAHAAGPTSAGPYPTYEQAESVAAPAVSSTAGGPWLAVIGFGIVSANSAFVGGANLTSVIASLNCSIAWTGTPDPTVLVPLTPNSAGSGHSAFWVVGFRNAVGAITIALVTDGVGAVLLEATGSTCESAASHLVSIGSIVDSPEAVAGANAAGGSAFLAADPNATQGWFILGGLEEVGIVTEPTWYIGDTTCTLPGSVEENGSEFNATVNGLTGDASTASNGSVNCAVSVTAPVGGLVPSFAAQALGKAI